MRSPASQLPRAMYLALAIVVAIYVLVGAVIVMTLSVPDIEANAGHVLSESAKAIFGQVGFVVIGVAALLATASGVNATMFGDANLAYLMAKTGGLPESFARNVWLGGTGGLFVAAALTALFVVFFPLSAVGQMASLAFLLIYATVSMGHFRVRSDTRANPWLLAVGVAMNVALFVLLLSYTIDSGPASTWITLLAVLAASFAFEALYRRRTGRTFAPPAPR